MYVMNEKKTTKENEIPKDDDDKILRLHPLPGEKVEAQAEKVKAKPEAQASPRFSLLAEGENVTEGEEEEGQSKLDAFTRSIDALIVQQAEQHRASFGIAPYATAYTIVRAWSELLDDLVGKAIRGIQIACKLSCASCCYQLTGAPTIYAMAACHAISGEMNGMNAGQIYNALRKFAKDSDKLMATLGYEDGVSTGNANPDKIKMESAVYWEKSAGKAYTFRQLRCPFLAKKTDMCLIYSVRPPACRLHYVVGDSAACKNQREAQYVTMPKIVYKVAYAPSAIYKQATGYGNIIRPFQRLVLALMNKRKGKDEL